MQAKIRGAIYGLLVGDAVGVPYEFNTAAQLPSYADIEMTPPSDFNRTYADIPIGTWSDDGAQALCLLASLLHAQDFDATDFAQRLLDWYQVGYMAVDAKVFDIGIQTRQALLRFSHGTAITEMAATDEYANGNGALMRCLPLALWHVGSDEQLVELAGQQSHLTHAHLRSKICCAFYCLWARYLLQGLSVDAAWSASQLRLNVIYHDRPAELNEMQNFIFPATANAIAGSGYVVDCLHSAKFALQQSNYTDVIKTAIALGNDTDTTACVAGGLAGIIFGVSGIPEHWLLQLRAKKMVEPLLEALMLHLAVSN